MSEVRGYAGGWNLEDALKEHAFSLELAYWIWKDILPSGTVIDVGAGPGFYSRFFYERGVDVTAIDSGSTENISLFPVLYWNALNLIHSKPPFDSVVCLEVGEHIIQDAEDLFIDQITSLASKKIIMSWAIPGQGGFGHVNCRPNEYIISQIEARGWKHNPEQSNFLRARCSGCPWFENTIMVFDK